MNNNKLKINNTPYIPLSKGGFRLKVIFWVFFTILALEVAIVAVTYKIIYNHTMYAAEKLGVLFLVWLVASSITAIAIITVTIRIIKSNIAKNIDRSETEHDTIVQLHAAMRNQELSVYYQPQVSLHTNEIIGMETLIRWNHIEKGFISPSQFIPLAEEAGFIEAIDMWVLETACEQNKTWLDQGYDLKVAVNVSALMFKNSNIVQIVEQILQKIKLPAGNLELEITETAMMKDLEAAIKIIRQLRDLGIVISMDDFGTGYSSLSTLQRFPIQKLKIDKSFVQSISKSDSGPNLADSIIHIGHNFGLKILVEGIETEYQKNYFVKHKCDQAQGFYFGEPVPPEDFIKLLQ